MSQGDCLVLIFLLNFVIGVNNVTQCDHGKVHNETTRGKGKKSR